MAKRFDLISYTHTLNHNTQLAHSHTSTLIMSHSIAGHKVKVNWFGPLAFRFSVCAFVFLCTALHFTRSAQQTCTASFIIVAFFKIFLMNLFFYLFFTHFEIMLAGKIFYRLFTHVAQMLHNATQHHGSGKWGKNSAPIFALFRTE